MTRLIILGAAGLLALAGCTRSGEAQGEWAGSYDAGNISPVDFDIVAHEEFEAATKGLISLHLEDGGDFRLVTLGTIEGDWSISGDTVTLEPVDAQGNELPVVVLELSKDGSKLVSRKDPDGARLTFVRRESARQD
jgi:hypothetical protein